MTAVIIDKGLVARRVARGLATYDEAAVVQREMAAQLVRRLVRVAGVRRFGNVLELGCGTGLFSRMLAKRCRVRTFVLNDLAACCERTATALRRDYPNTSFQFLAGDMENVALPGGQDLVASNASLQWTADPLCALGRMTDCLTDGGHLAVASFGPGTLTELAQAGGGSLPYLSLAELRAALADRCDVVEAAEEDRTVWFADGRDLLRHLRHTGANALSAESWTRRDLQRFCGTYAALFGRDDGAVPATFRPVYLIARKRAGRKEAS